MIHIHEELLSREQSEELIFFYNHNSNNSELHDGNHKIFLTNYRDDSFIKEITNRVDKLCKSLWLPPSYRMVLQNSALSKWSNGYFKESNRGNPEDIFAVLIFLNDNYNGGEINIDNTASIKPEVGKGVIFSNSKYYHSINEVKNGDGYVLCFWYINVNR